jgi:hypothetical protein
VIVHDSTAADNHKHDSSAKGTLEVRSEGLSQGNDYLHKETSIDIFFIEYKDVCNTYKKHTLLGYFVG